MPVVRNVWLPILVLMPAAAAGCTCCPASTVVLGKEPGLAQHNSGAAFTPEGYLSFNSFSAIAYHE